MSRTTDAEGRFRFEQCPIGSYTLELRLPGQWMSDALTKLEGVEPGAAEPTLVVPAAQVPRASLCGRATNEAGEPVPGAVASLRSRGETFVMTETEAGPDGRFAFPFLPEQEYVLSLEAEGFEALMELDVEALGEGEARDLGALELRPAD